MRFARDSAQAALKALDECSAPISVNHLAAIAGLDVRESDAVPNALRARLVGRTIELAPSDSSRGKRFSVAHELGHHRMGTVHGASSRSEAEADHFANELLVPRQLLVSAVQSSTDVRELADLFEVSSQVIRIAAEYHKIRVT
ncbi:MAG: ImmA/IrrE family metallo-endopeptidase [bacterium]